MNSGDDDDEAARQRPQVLCAWCLRIVEPGNPNRISHGICDDCLPPLIASLNDDPESPPARRSA